MASGILDSSLKFHLAIAKKHLILSYFLEFFNTVLVVTRTSHRQGVLRIFSGQKCKKFKNRSVQNRNTSATTSGSVPFLVTLVLHFECVFREVQHIFVLSLTFLSKVRLIKNAYYCILIHLIAYCAFFAFPVHKKDTAPCISAKRGARVSIGFRSVHLFQSLLQVLCDLVRAAGVAEPAQRTVQTCNDVLGLHAGDQLA